MMVRQRSTLSNFLWRLGLLIAIPVLILLGGFLIAALLLGHLLYRVLLTLLVWIFWCPKGKDTLLVYSNSPHWQDYMACTVLPPIAQRTIVLNWSDRRMWKVHALPVRVFRHFAGTIEFNPVVIVIRPFRWPRTFRFWQAFHNRKHGNSDQLQQVEAQLFRYLRTQRPS